MNKMKISFITPTYNRVDMVLETVESIIKSVERKPNLNFEIIIIDDASTDNTEEVIKEIHKDLFERGVILYDRMSVNIGVTGAKKRGVEVSSGDWLVFIDSDDLLLPNSFEDMLNVIRQKSDYGIIFFSCVDFSGNPIGKEVNSHALSVSEYIEYGTYGEKLPVIERQVALEYPYEADLRGFESIAYYRAVFSGVKLWVDSLVCRQYRTDNGDRISGRKNQIRRACFLSKGYDMLVQEFNNKNFKVPKKIHIKLFFYKLLCFVCGK